jgi:pimeloyl-ACP methyl ester carboxylesterase
MAFAIYRAPKNFSRAGLDDSAVSRNVTLQVSCPDNSGSPTTASTSVLSARPPVVLVHGLWSDPTAWDNFNPLATPDSSIGDHRFFVRRANFSNPVSGITASTPTYSSSVLQSIRQNALGFAYNAPFVLETIQSDIMDFKNRFNVAAVQADVVGHSMGGDITRAMVSLPNFASDDTYGFGPVHKLITVGTPHLGTPLAAQLLQSSNNCVRKQLAAQNNISLQDITVQGVSVNGAVGDLQGDGFGGGLSVALTSLPSNQPFAVAYIGGTVTSGNLSGLDCGILSGCIAAQLRLWCDHIPPSNPLAANLTSQNWPNVFGQASDAIVPVLSQLNGGTAGLVFTGLIHSSSIEQLNFSGPAELDTASPIPSAVVNLLNENITGSDFHHN